MRLRKAALAATVGVLATTALAAPTLMSAAPAASARGLDGVAFARASAENPYVETPTAPGAAIASVWSPAMGTQVPVEVRRPAGGRENAPVMYLLNGSSGGEEGDDWTRATDAGAFYSAREVWSVTPIGGSASYYADWRAVDPAANFRFGVTSDRPLRWETFLTSELPAAFESRHGGSGPGRSRGLAGISMSGNAVVRIAEKHPGLYRAVGAYSGCAEIASLPGQVLTRVVTAIPGAADASNMYGPPGDPQWVAEDPVVNAAKLREHTPALWISAGNGLPGGHDTLTDPRINGDVLQLAQQLTAGGLAEAATLYCTVNLTRRLTELGIPHTARFTPNGTHSWGYWEDQMHESWPTFAGALGV